MEDFMTPERKSYIAQLEKQIQAMDRILRMDAGTVISQERRRQLQNLREDSKKVLNKLVNNEFEIAIVGLEKAGKSTFANALMENPLLPTKDARCTFTSTQIEYSGDSQPDSATVTFYTVDEFNQDFRDKLSKLGIPNPEKYSFDTLNEATYNRLYESEVSEDKQRAYGDSIHPDIVSIIQNETSLSSLLDRPPLAFSSAQIESGELTAYITDEAKARAVKQVVIHSRKLFEMKNAVIFDVPGFNSPTELHKAQTLARMKSADAIIVVASGTSPSLTGESLKILRESDDEGNLLQDKLFVFANKTDGADDIGLNIQETYKEWIGKKFILEKNKHRIVFGSALAHLQAAGLSKDDRVLKVFRERRPRCPTATASTLCASSWPPIIRTNGSMCSAAASTAFGLS